MCDFPFRAECDKAAWLASVLTLVARGAIDGPVPGFLISANLAGTGKSWLATLAGLIASGRLPAMDGYQAEPDEMAKVLTTIACDGDRCLVLDNAPNGSAIGSHPLDRAITARGAFRGRILGKNQNSPDVPWIATIFVTGNNIHTRDDSLRRFLPILLDFPDEKPETRDPKKYKVYIEHKLDLQAYVLKHRTRLVAAALTLIRGFLAADEQPAELVAMDFPEWDRIVRQAVYYATKHDPCGSRPEMDSEDETLGERIRLVNGWVALCTAADKPNGLTVEEATIALARFESDPEQRPLIETFS